jgi:hypothetical protein
MRIFDSPRNWVRLKDPQLLESVGAWLRDALNGMWLKFDQRLEDFHNTFDLGFAAAQLLKLFENSVELRVRLFVCGAINVSVHAFLQTGSLASPVTPPSATLGVSGYRSKGLSSGSAQMLLEIRDGSGWNGRLYS